MRTRQTWDLIAQELPNAPAAAFDNFLYLAGPDVLMGRLRQASAPCVIVIAHNPGIAEFAHRLLAVPMAHPGFNGFPTCATLVAEFYAPDWAQLEFGTGRGVDFTVPRDLL